MKLFQQLLVAPAALGLMAPMAATAAELSPSVSDYSDSIAEVQSISDFSDVYPTDWAYKALTDLAERHGCAASTPSGAITRYEAAALLNKCLGNVAQVNDEERRLLNEFGSEIAVIKGRVDSLEARIGEFEAGQFSTTTKLTGKTTFVVGAVDRHWTDGDCDHSRGVSTSRADCTDTSGVSFSFSQQLNLNTSFNGEDLLYTRVKTGNMPSTWAGSDPGKKYGTYLSSGNANASYTVDKIWYQFPVGESFKVWVGPKIENYYMLASAPSIYKPVFKQFALGGNGLTYGASTGAGFGAAWTQQVDNRNQPRFAVSVNHVSGSGDSADASAGGIMTDDDNNTILSKVEYGNARWQASVAYSKKDKNKGTADYFATEAGKARTGETDAVALRGYWRPDSDASGYVPSITVGYDFANIDDDGSKNATKEAAQWMVGLNWDDVLFDGNRAGFAFGQRAYATNRTAPATGNDDLADDNFTWEAYYDFKVSDNITITPAIMAATDSFNGSADDVFAGLIQTTFKF